MTVAAIDRLVHHAVIFELTWKATGAARPPSARHRNATQTATSKRTTEKGDLILSQICPSVSLSLDPETTHGHA